jgi:predicted AAA+ superfamily ATPase
LSFTARLCRPPAYRSHATVHRWLNLLEACHLAVRLPAVAVNRTERLIKSPKLPWGDSGLALHIAGEAYVMGTTSRVIDASHERAPDFANK